MVVVDHFVHKYDEILCSVHHGGHPASHHGPPVGEGHGGASPKKKKFYFGEHLISIITTEIAGMRPSTVLCPMRRKAAKIISHLGINEPESNRRSLSLKLTNTNEMGVRLS